MLLTRLDEVPIGPPAACVWQGQLVVAWADGNRGGAISVAVGNAVTAGSYAPSIARLDQIAYGVGKVALAEFSGRLYLGWMDAPTGALAVASSNDGVTFSSQVALVGSANDGPSLHGGDQLLASWIEYGSRRIVIAASDDGVTFSAPLVLSHDADGLAACTSYEHPYLGARVALVWDSDTGLVVSIAPAKSLQGLDAAPMQIWNGGRPALCVSGPPASTYTGPTIALGTEDRLALLSVDVDGSRASAPRWGPASSSAPAVAATGTDLLLAYTEYVSTQRLLVGSWDQAFDLPADLRDRVGQPCNPRQCTDDPRLVCVLTGEMEVEQRSAEVSNARRGDLILTPADGDGVIGTILKNVDPPQFYDHMGIMLADATTIRHCTEAKDRVIGDKSYYTGSLLGDPAPTDGLRPDLIKYGWPGPITQTIQDGFFDGWNGGLNLDWTYRGASHATLTPEQEKAFFDPEHIETPVHITNLTYTPTYRADHQGPVWPLVVRPPRAVEARMPWVRWALERVADHAAGIRGHYRFYAYTDALIAVDTSRFAPPVGDAAWAGMAEGADWAAGTPGIVCSTFVWLAAQQATAGLVPQLLLDQDHTSPRSGAARMQTVLATIDGLYEYHVGERTDSANALHDWIVTTVRGVVKRRADAQLTGLARVGIGAAAAAVAGAPWGLLGATLSPADATDLVIGLTDMPEHVANGVCNAFASDTPQRVDDQAWKQPGTGKSVSPDDILDFWDAPAELSLPDPHAELFTASIPVRSGLWGDSEQMMLVNPRPELVPVGRLAVSPGVAEVRGIVTYGGHALVGAEVRIGCRKTYTNAHSGFALDVSASPDDNDQQLIEVRGYWDSPPGMVSTQLRRSLVVGLNNLGDIRLKPPPEWRRRVEFHGELMMKHQVMFGHDTIDHHTWSASCFVQCDPDMAALDNTAYEAAISQTFSASTLRCGGQRAVFGGTVSMYDPTGPNQAPPEGALAVIVDWRFGMWEGEDDDEDEIDHQSGQTVVPGGQTRMINPSLRDGEIPPDRAHAEITVDNFVNPA